MSSSCTHVDLLTDGAHFPHSYAQFEEIINRIGAVVIEETNHTELLLVPSLRDVHHDNVYPQPPYVVHRSFL